MHLPLHLNAKNRALAPAPTRTLFFNRANRGSVGKPIVTPAPGRVDEQAAVSGREGG